MSKKRNTYLSGQFFVLASIILVVGGLIWLGSTKEEGTANASSGSLSVSETSWNLGMISMKDGLNEKKIELKNETDSPVTVTEMQTSCMCTTATVINENGRKGPTKGMVGHGGTPRMSQVIAPGETAQLAVVYDPNAHGPDAVGPITRNVTIRTDSADQPKIDLRFSGIVTK